MKYCNYWKSQLNLLPNSLQKECINYKKWKKINSIDQDIYKILEDICCHVDKIFLKTKSNKNDLLTFANINKQTLYKLTKRLEKKYGHNIVEWYNNNKTKYQFCKGYKVKRLDLEINGCEEYKECPICLDEKDEMIINNCEHIVCSDCFKKLYRIDNLNGTIFNLVNHSVFINHFVPKCPTCRETMPTHLKEDQIIKCSECCKKNGNIPSPKFNKFKFYK
jgi:hypothetical protein